MPRNQSTNAKQARQAQSAQGGKFTNWLRNPELSRRAINEALGSTSKLNPFQAPAKEGLEAAFRRHYPALKYEVYIQSGHPWWNIDSWLAPRLMEALRPTRWENARQRGRLSGLRRKLLAEASGQRSRLVSSDYSAPRAIHLEQLTPLLKDAVKGLCAGGDVPRWWDAEEKQHNISNALTYIDWQLTNQQRLAVHARMVLNLSPNQCARILDATPRRVVPMWLSGRRR